MTSGNNCVLCTHLPPVGLLYLFVNNLFILRYDGHDDSFTIRYHCEKHSKGVMHANWFSDTHYTDNWQHGWTKNHDKYVTWDSLLEPRPNSWCVKVLNAHSTTLLSTKCLVDKQHSLMLIILSLNLNSILLSNMFAPSTVYTVERFITMWLQLLLSNCNTILVINGPDKILFCQKTRK